ncbi:benzoate-CoA ligase family protein [Chroococcidiopsis sp. FACHB-1243]|uniref:benzoate-CoA ligase family protein n=1 Tax=Chroococcidiopsis sp. [FACHB-1243] TaxID=2692781 RepID=UPI001787046E|nr:benzoate-CoA ligase family protein [Chroococcidiopsis sp. [FACHB-1243]]MBD2309022.1 benzoate-CoA ligase family protein [Chroococcidiopsis sp. [FACHB-1243]]
MENISELPSVLNVAAYFIESNLAQGRSEKTAFYYRDEAYTYAQVSSFVRRSARLLANLGLERENRIAILLPDSPEFIFAFWGAIWLGAVPVPINTTCNIDDIQYILQDSRAKVLLTTQAWQEKLAPIHSQFLRCILLADGENPFVSLLAQQDELLAYTDATDEAAFWLYTSGSTGRPKGAIHLHQSMVVCAESYAKATLGLHENDITYSVAKMPFAYGLGNTLYMPMAVGATSVLSDANNAFDIIADIQRYRPTILFGIPSVYASILALADISPLDVSSLRLCVSAAEQLPKIIWYKWLQTYNHEICEGIGTTEFLHIFLSNRVGECKPGSSGRPVSGYDVQIIDDNGFSCSPGEIGNLQVAGESLMLGYWRRVQQTRKAIYGNTMRTGDKYLRDADGYFWFMGRTDDLFKVNGQWISPLEIEDILHQHPQIFEVAVVPDGNEEQLTQIVAYISLKQGQESSPELEMRIRQFARQRLPHFKVPNKVCFIEKLPRTSTGKIHRQLLSKKLSLLTHSSL